MIKIVCFERECVSVCVFAALGTGLVRLGCLLARRRHGKHIITKK